MSTARPVPAATDTLPPDALRFCMQHGLMPGLREAVRLADVVWHPVGPMSIELEADPETTDEWLVVMVPVAGSVEDVVRREHEFTRQWIQAAPFEEREKIRVLFDVVAP